jgi:hypothetical protein
MIARTPRSVGNAAATRALVRAGADVDAPDDAQRYGGGGERDMTWDGVVTRASIARRTPLHHAVMCAHGAECVTALCELGARVDARDVDGTVSLASVVEVVALRALMLHVRLDAAGARSVGWQAARRRLAKVRGVRARARVCMCV